MNNPLESVLSLKRWEEDEAKNLFAMARKDLDQEEMRLEVLEKNFRSFNEKIRIGGNKVSTIDEMKQAQIHMDHILRLLQRQKELVAISRKRLDDAAKIMTVASKERKIFEKVDERHKAAERHDTKKKEERVIDEHAVQRYKRPRE